MNYSVSTAPSTIHAPEQGLFLLVHQLMNQILARKETMSAPQSVNCLLLDVEEIYNDPCNCIQSSQPDDVFASPTPTMSITSTQSSMESTLGTNQTFPKHSKPKISKRSTNSLQRITKKHKTKENLSPYETVLILQAKHIEKFHVHTVETFEKELKTNMYFKRRKSATVSLC